MRKLRVKIADTTEKREKGLMYVKKLAQDEGMFFKFPYSHYPRFWMKNTYIPLDIAFINDQGKILQIETMKALSTNAVSSENKCRFALEVPAGWFKENAVEVGHYISGYALKRELKGMNHLSQVVKKPKDSKKERKEKPKEDPKPIETEPVIEENPEAVPEAVPEVPPEIGAEGNYPQSVLTVPHDETQKPEIEYVRDIRGKIKLAEEHGLPMEIIYSTIRGHMLPPRRVQPIEGEGYPIKSGPSGEMLVAFDTSPTIQGEGWSIKGMQPKSFVLKNIISMQIMDTKGNQLTDEQVGQIKSTGTFTQEQQPQQPQQMMKEIPEPLAEKEKVKQEKIWNKIKNKQRRL